MDKKRKIKTFLIISILSILIINLTLISGYMLFIKYGSMTLSPGENYNVNIPFDILKKGISPVVCGVAELKNGTRLSNINVSVSYSDKEEVLESALTDSDGEYCITLPAIQSDEDYDIYLNYKNEIEEGELIALNTSIETDFDDNVTYNKNDDNYVYLTGDITSENARIDNGSIEIKVRYDDPIKNWTDITDYEKHLISLNIIAGETYSIGETDNLFWEIPEDAETGQYKFLVKTSFNAKESSSKTVFFFLTN